MSSYQIKKGVFLCVFSLFYVVCYVVFYVVWYVVCYIIYLNDIMANTAALLAVEGGGNGLSLA